jgi:hypothetical protein
MSSYNHNQPISATVWTITHGLTSKFLAIDVLELVSGGIHRKVKPVSTEIIDFNIVAVHFATPIAGVARVVA